MLKVSTSPSEKLTVREPNLSWTESEDTDIALACRGLRIENRNEANPTRSASTMTPVREFVCCRQQPADFEVAEFELIFETVQCYRSKIFEMNTTKFNTLEYFRVCFPSE